MYEYVASREQPSGIPTLGRHIIKDEVLPPATM